MEDDTGYNVRAGNRTTKMFHWIDWKSPYRFCLATYVALMTIAGLLVMAFQGYFWQWMPNACSLSVAITGAGWDRVLVLGVLSFVGLDLVRASLANQTISFSFPIILIALLYSPEKTGIVLHPGRAILIAVIGSWLSEMLYSQLWKPRLGWIQTLIRAFAYAGHHAVAGFSAAFVFISLNPPLEGGLDELQTVLAHILGYVLCYAIVSSLLIRPYDWWVRRLLAPGERQLPRVSVFPTLVLTPVPVVLYLLYVERADVGVSSVEVYVLALLYLLLLLVVRSFVVERRAGREGDILDQLGAPPNLRELVRNAFKTIETRIDCRWGAVYSLEGEGGTLCLKGSRLSVGCAPSKREETSVEDPELEMPWPLEIKEMRGCLGEAIRRGEWQAVFHFGDDLVDLQAEALCVPAGTAILTLPLRAEHNLVGAMVLARPGKLFTTSDLDKAQSFTRVFGSTFHTVLQLDEKLQALDQEIQRNKDPQRLQQAVDELQRRGVNIPSLIAEITERSFHTNLRAVLRDVVTDRPTGGRLALSDQALEDIYQHIQGQTPGMPPWAPEIRDLLRTMTSGLSLAFSFRYQFPELEHRGEEYRELYEVFVRALDVENVSGIVGRGADIEQAISQLQRSAVPARVVLCEQLERLLGIVEFLQEVEEAEADVRERRLQEALDVLPPVRVSIRQSLEDPERFTLIQIANAWQKAITNALYAVQEGEAELAMSLRCNYALPVDTTVELVLENEGQGLAAGVLAEICSSQDYRIVGQHRVPAGPLFPGTQKELDFSIEPQEGLEALHVQFLVTYRDRGRREMREKFGDRLYLRDSPPPFRRIPNRYIPGMPLNEGSPVFFGREDIFDFIRQNLRAVAAQQGIIVLVGERRTGKTSIVKQLPARLAGGPYVCAFLDCQGVGVDPGMDNFFLSLAEAIADGVEAAGLRIERLTLHDLEGSPKHVFEREFLPRVWESIGDRFLLLTVDEYESLEGRIRDGQLPRAVLPYLRSLMQHQDKMAFIFVGTHRIEDLAGDYWSILFNIAQYKHVGFLKPESAEKLIVEPVKSRGMAYDDLAIAEILKLTAGHPYFLQFVCNELVNQCNAQKRNYVTIQDVRDARGRIMESSGQHLSFVWLESSAQERAALAALAYLRRSEEWVTVDHIVEHLSSLGISLKALYVVQSLERLVRRDIVKKMAGELDYYRFTAWLYCLWIQKHKSPAQVALELSELEAQSTIRIGVSA